VPTPEKRRPPTGPSEGTPVPDRQALALEAAALGLAVFALEHGAKTPTAGSRGLKDATTDPDTIRRTITNGQNYGILGGPDVLVLDCDDPAQVDVLEATFGELADAPAVRTPRGGRHWYLRANGWRMPTRAKAAEGLDVRGFGRAYVVGPGSTVNGRTYEAVRPLVRAETLPAASDALREYLHPTPAPRHADPMPRHAPPVAGDRAARWAAAALEAEAATVRGVGEGGRRDALNAAAFALGQIVGGGHLTEAEVTAELRAAVASQRPPLPDAEADRTIADGIRDGRKTPRHPPTRDGDRAAGPSAPQLEPIDPADLETTVTGAPADVPAEPDAPADPASSQPRRRKANGPAPGDERPRLPNLVRLSTVEPVAVEHLDDGRLALGKLTLMVGDAGAGKTHIALSIAANLTRGRPPFPIALSPGGKYREPANVLALIGEDGLGDTIRGRFDAAEGDASRFYALTGVTVTEPDGETRERDVDLTQLDVLDHAMRELRPALVIVDPVQVYLGPNADMHKANEVRAALKGAAKLAERYNAALLIIGHLNKGNGGGKALYRALGSIDFVAIARSVLVVGEHNGVSAVAHAKANLSPKAPTLTYTLEGGALAWTGTTATSADELTSGPAHPYDSPKLAEAATWLGDMLDGQARKVSDLEALAKRAGIAWRTVRRASDELGVTKRKVGTVGTESYWVWEIEG
jgi:hypothetical protein